MIVLCYNKLLTEAEIVCPPIKPHCHRTCKPDRSCEPTMYLRVEFLYIIDDPESLPVSLAPIPYSNMPI